MTNFIEKILNTFTHGEYPLWVQSLFRSWMAGPKHRAEKDAALENVWNEAASAKEPRGMTASIRRMQRSIGIEVFILRRRLVVWQFAAAAAVVMFIAGTSLLYFRPVSEMDIVESYTPLAQINKIVLPDGTGVTLNAGSTLLYPHEFRGKTRSVYLTGEASFSVKSDKKHPFVVKTNDLAVKALGTQFNVSAYPENAELTATLIEGVIEVNGNDFESIILNPNDQFVFDRLTRQGRVSHVEVDDVTAWEKGELVFRSMSLDDIFAGLERKYHYMITYNKANLKQGKYSFRFQKDATLDEVMHIISQVAGDISYSINEEKCNVLITKQ